MKLVAVSVVRNEADIVEAFVRHTCGLVEGLVILDEQSTDGTREILAELVREGLPVVLLGGRPESRAAACEIVTSRALAGGADWILPLNADEILLAADRPALVARLDAAEPAGQLRVPRLTYLPTTADDPAEINPVRRIRHRKGKPDSARIFLARAEAQRKAIACGEPVCDVAGASEDLAVACFPLRSAAQEMVRVVKGELQRLARGPAQAGLDTHYRLGFQLLAQEPAAFVGTMRRSPDRLVLDPAAYCGGPLRWTAGDDDLTRAMRMLLPTLEAMARRHGELAERLGDDAGAAPASGPVELLVAAEVPRVRLPGRPAFAGFEPVSGWEAGEGPVPVAFLPRFHWATAPETVVAIQSDGPKQARLHAEVLSYAERQVTTVLLNGVELHRRVFSQVNEKETLLLPLGLADGANRLVFRHRAWVENPADPRKLALIFLRLVVEAD